MQSSWQFPRFVFISIFMENSWLFSSPFIKSTQSINKMFRIDLSDRYHDYENASKQAALEGNSAWGDRELHMIS